MTNKSNNRDNFSPTIIENVAKRASYICSNPDCHAITTAPSESDPSKFQFIGIASHITAAAPKGPRYVPSLTPQERKSISNAIFLCSSCATMIDKNKGIDYPADLLREWKDQHENWVKENLNKSITNLCEISVIEGEFVTIGEKNVKGFDINSSTVIKPGTRSLTIGKENVTGVRIGPKNDDK